MKKIERVWYKGDYYILGRTLSKRNSRRILKLQDWFPRLWLLLFAIPITLDSTIVEDEDDLRVALCRDEDGYYLSYPQGHSEEYRRLDD
jgi:hypothetical protein